MGVREAAIHAIETGNPHTANALATVHLADVLAEVSQVEHLKKMLDARPEVNIINSRSGKSYVTLKFSDGTIHEYTVTNKKVHR